MKKTRTNAKDIPYGTHSESCRQPVQYTAAVLRASAEAAAQGPSKVRGRAILNCLYRDDVG